MWYWEKKCSIAIYDISNKRHALWWQMWFFFLQSFQTVGWAALFQPSSIIMLAHFRFFILKSDFNWFLSINNNKRKITKHKEIQMCQSIVAHSIFWKAHTNNKGAEYEIVINERLQDKRLISWSIYLYNVPRLTSLNLCP